ncbi:MAG: nuclear transport factor 2 family protein [Gemmatimonadetes bacterium]|nr:nuclear transport factor 2 family protein [Gemmatimonadota bacterium]NNM07377.1 nuclear transport factor 2 family protein [Gemmatimonadota bacterium]
MKKIFRSLLVLTAVLAISCAAPPEEAPPVDLAAEEAAVRVVVDQFGEMWETEDVGLAAQIFSQGPDLLVYGTDAAEVWVGYDLFAASLEEQFASYEDTEVTTRDQVVTVHSSGEIAWMREIADWHVTVGGERMEVNDMRVTGVLEKRDGAWLFVQMHVSVPVSGQIVAY